MKNPYALILLVAATTAYGQINNPPTSVNIVDSTATGRAVLTATNAAAAATAIGLGTANEVTFNRVQVGGASFSADDFSGGNFVVTGGHALTFSSGGTSGATLTNLGLGAANNVTFSNITANGIVTANDSTATPATSAAAAQGIQWPGLGGSQHAAIYGGYAGAAQIALAVGTSNSLSDVATFSATGMTVNSNAIVGGTLGVTGNATFSGTANLAPSQTADSGSSLMTRDLSDARFYPLASYWLKAGDMDTFNGAGAGAATWAEVSPIFNMVTPFSRAPRAMKLLLSNNQLTRYSQERRLRHHHRHPA
jgi:hypothetical protein